jgi:hypothetical protein
VTDEEMDPRLDEQPELTDRLRAGYSRALDDLLEAGTSARISTVEVRLFKVPEFVGVTEVAAGAPPGPGRRRPRRQS